MTMPTFAATLIDQLGGNRFIAMTGAKEFVYDEKKSSLRFRIGRGAKNKANIVTIRLNDMDLYDIEFHYLRGINCRLISEHSDIYAEQLREMFTKETGFYTSL